MGPNQCIPPRSQKSSPHSNLVLGKSLRTGHYEWRRSQKHHRLLLRIDYRNWDLQWAEWDENWSFQSAVEVLFEKRGKVHVKRTAMWDYGQRLKIRDRGDFHRDGKRDHPASASQPRWRKDNGEEVKEVQEEDLLRAHEYWKDGLKDIGVLWS